MTTVTMLEFRKNAESVLRRIAKGERFVLSHRGKAVARLEPLNQLAAADPDKDPFLTINARAQPSDKGRTNHHDLDRIIYGGK